MIGSFKHRGLKRFFERDDPRRLPPDMVEKIRLILGELNTAEVVKDLDLHSFNLHPLTGDRQDEWSKQFGPTGGSLSALNKGWPLM